jgi:hypothetical protein
MAQAVSRRPLTTAARVSPMGFVVDKVALGQVFLRVLRFSRVSIIPFRYVIHISFIPSSTSSADRQKARKSSRSPARRQSHPHKQNTRSMLSLDFVV